MRKKVTVAIALAAMLAATPMPVFARARSFDDPYHAFNKDGTISDDWKGRGPTSIYGPDELEKFLKSRHGQIVKYQGPMEGLVQIR